MLLAFIQLYYGCCIFIAAGFYFFGPQNFNPLVNSTFAFAGIVAYLFSILAVRKILGYYNWFGFFSLFSISFLICGLQYPFQSLFIDDIGNSDFLWGNYLSVGQSTGLYLVAFLTFIIGYLSGLKKGLFELPERLSGSNTYNVDKFITIGTVSSWLLFILFIGLVGSSFLSGAYDGMKNWGAGSTYVFLLLQILSYVSFSLDVYRLRNLGKRLGMTSFILQLNKLLLLLFVVLILVNIYVGERGVVVQIITLIVGSFYFHFRKASFTTFLTLACVGALIMTALSFYRTRDATASLDDRIFNASVGMVDLKWYSITADLAASCRINAAAIQYFRDDPKLGATMVTQLASVAPFMPGLLLKTAPYTGIEGNSSFIFTQLLNPVSVRTGNQTGAGSTPFGDVYLNFGCIGIFIFFPILGIFMSKIEIRAKYTTCLYNHVQNGIILTWAVYWPRAVFFAPLRFLIWGLLLTYLAVVISRRK